MGWLYHKPINKPSLSVPLRKLFSLQPIMEILFCFSLLFSSFLFLFLFFISLKNPASSILSYLHFTHSKGRERVKRRRRRKLSENNSKWGGERLRSRGLRTQPTDRLPTLRGGMESSRKLRKSLFYVMLGFPLLYFLALERCTNTVALPLRMYNIYNIIYYMCVYEVFFFLFLFWVFLVLLDF